MKKIERGKFKTADNRILKTGIAIFICLFSSLFRTDEPIVFYSAIAAVICMKESFKETGHMGINRIIGTYVGAFFGYLFLVFDQKYETSVLLRYFLITLSVMFVMRSLHMSKKPAALSVCAIVFLSIVLNHADDVNPMQFAIQRSIDTVVGVLAAVFVNLPEVFKKGYGKVF